MKKILLSLFAFAAITLSANAQQEGRKMMKGVDRHHEKNNKQMMMKELNLSDTQQQQMKANREAFKKQMQELNKNENITVKEQRDRKEALKKEQKAKMMAILTPDQKAKMEQMKKDKQAQRELKFAQKMEKMRTNLGLSDDQFAKIKAERTANHAKMQAIRDNEKLSRTERKEQLMALKEQNKESIKKYLTPEQIKKMEEMKQHKGKKTVR
ncbi:hypothetical protein LK994_00885 [Ferruginibacter lapsinanis]|uniref:hypothetical protein n=1 Tax=Ferruginibacter lapsinanis TaxID=563172 RepID=UPI001E3C95F5|nr:hypothetical protein [Ferruginibacter lapsinanis]UEG50028.1 hypothetical protein LK994_00885 [Ferruginibacter lapsinanis]